MGEMGKYPERSSNSLATTKSIRNRIATDRQPPTTVLHGQTQQRSCGMCSEQTIASASSKYIHIVIFVKDQVLTDTKKTQHSILVI